jgi:hypothetical protein
MAVRKMRRTSMLQRLNQTAQPGLDILHLHLLRRIGENDTTVPENPATSPGKNSANPQVLPEKPPPNPAQPAS